MRLYHWLYPRTWHRETSLTRPVWLWGGPYDGEIRESLNQLTRLRLPHRGKTVIYAESLRLSAKPNTFDYQGEL